MKKKKLLIMLSLCVAAMCVVGALVVNAVSDDGKNGEFNGLPAHVDEEGNLYIDEVNFPDGMFREEVRWSNDTDGDGMFSVAEVDAVTEIVCSFDGISTLEGIEYFSKLESLDCHQNELTTLDVSKCTALTYLFCGGNMIETLDISGCTSLERLKCSRNSLTELDVSGWTTLTYLDCAENMLTSLDVSDCTSLETLICWDNELTSLDVSTNTALTTLNCHDNDLTSLDVSTNKALTTLNCFNNKLTSLDISKNTALTDLDCGSNNLTSLDVSKNTALTDLDCSENKLTSLDVSKNAALTNLDCSSNNLTSLDVSKNTVLTDLDCSENKLTSLDVSKNTALTNLDCSYNKLTALDISENVNLSTLECYYNYMKPVDVSANTKLKKIDDSPQTIPEECEIYIDSDTFKADLSLIIERYGITNIESIVGNIKYYDEYHYWTESDIDGEFDEQTGIVTFSEDALGIDICISLERDILPQFVYHITAELTEEDDTYVAVDENNFPDKAFREYVSESFDTNGDGRLSMHEIARVNKIDCSELGISDLTGIKVFTNLDEIFADNNKITSLDIAGLVNLYRVDVSYNNLSSISFGENEATEYFYCSHNELTDIDLLGLGDKLSNGPVIDLSYNKLTKVPTYYHYIWELDLSHNPISTLDLKGVSGHRLRAEYCNITEIVEGGRIGILQLDGNHIVDPPYDFVSGLDQYNAKNQTSIKTLCAAETDRGWEVDISKLISEKSLSRIDNVTSDVGDGVYNPETGIVVFSQKPTQIVYALIVGYYGNANYSYVTVNICDIGDADGDGEIGNSDALAIFTYMFSQDSSALDTSAADVNGDGEVTNADALMVLRHIYDPSSSPLN